MITNFLLILTLTLLSPAYQSSYDFNSPSQTFLMPPALQEISGLSMDADQKNLIAVNDEEGIVYYLDPKTGQILTAMPFWKEGDYEGIEYANGHTYAVKSTGTIYQIIQEGTTVVDVSKFKFFLHKDHDVEALTYDAKKNRLLIGCKGNAEEDPYSKNAKAFFAFDLATNTMDSEPALLIKQDDVNAFLDLHPDLYRQEKLKEFFDPNGEGFRFSPSGIAIHPKSGHYYITSSIGKILIVLSEKGGILHIQKLDKEIHPQPEGICFAPDGTLFIANEAKKDSPAQIQRFEYQPQH